MIFGLFRKRHEPTLQERKAALDAWKAYIQVSTMSLRSDTHSAESMVAHCESVVADTWRQVEEKFKAVGLRVKRTTAEAGHGYELFRRGSKQVLAAHTNMTGFTAAVATQLNLPYAKPTPAVEAASAPAVIAPPAPAASTAVAEPLPPAVQSAPRFRITCMPPKNMMGGLRSPAEPIHLQADPWPQQITFRMGQLAAPEVTQSEWPPRPFAAIVAREAAGTLYP